MNRTTGRWVLCFAVGAWMPALASAQEQPKPDGEQPVVKVYRVIDLVLPAPNYPYEGTYLPGLRESGATKPLTSGGMGGMGGGMGGMGGGMMSVPNHLAQQAGGGAIPAGGAARSAAVRAGATAIDMDDLIEAITGTVEPGSWDEVGGEGTITPIGGALAIRQSPANQAKVQEFLEMLKRESGTLDILAIEARWLLLDRTQVSQLQANADAEAKSSGARTLDAKALAALPTENELYAGRISCFNGQTVHLVSGRLETVIGGAIPVVGGNEVGYQPVMLAPHLGVMLEVTPSRLPNGDGVLVDLRSSITRWEKPGQPAKISTSPTGDIAIDVDRIHVTAQQFATSMRMPLEKPVLVGGITFPSSDAAAQATTASNVDAAGKGKGLYLVLEVHSSQDR